MMSFTRKIESNIVKLADKHLDFCVFLFSVSVEIVQMNVSSMQELHGQ